MRELTVVSGSLESSEDGAAKQACGKKEVSAAREVGGRRSVPEAPVTSTLTILTRKSRVEARESFPLLSLNLFRSTRWTATLGSR